MIEFGWGDYDETYKVLMFKGKWSSKDFIEMVQKLYYEIRKAGRNINLLIDLRYSHSPPNSIIGLLIQAIAKRPPNFGRVIVVSTSNIWKRLYEVASATRASAPLDIHFTTTVDQAYELLVSASN